MTIEINTFCSISLDQLADITGGQRVVPNGGLDSRYNNSYSPLQGAATGINPKVKNLPGDMVKGCVTGGAVGARKGPAGAAVGCAEGAASTVLGLVL